jgi:Zn finger protein HypA/HybF involved in hydrogenase expression
MSYQGWLGRHAEVPVHIRCKCGEEWDGTEVSEEGAAWLEPREDCPKCGSTELETDELDALDIEERRLEARGVDF